MKPVSAMDWMENGAFIYYTASARRTSSGVE